MTYDLRGKRFGKLTVLEKLPERKSRYCMWRCRCDCGREISASTKELSRGTVTACPDCERQKRNTKALDLTGQRFGRLTVLSLSDKRQGGRRTWDCLCDCGNTALATTHELRAGKTKSCGCLVSERLRSRYKDLTGERIGMLTVLHATEKRSAKGSIIWRCRCDCGTECDYSEDSLLYGRVVSCGCRKEELQSRINDNLHRVEGTCVEHLNRKIRTDNKSGCPGVFELKNGSWRAGIGFKGKRYYLGTYANKEDAIRARLRGEEMHEDFLKQYYSEHPEQKERRRKRKKAQGDEGLERLSSA